MYLHVTYIPAEVTNYSCFVVLQNVSHTLLYLPVLLLHVNSTEELCATQTIVSLCVQFCPLRVFNYATNLLIFKITQETLT